MASNYTLYDSGGIELTFKSTDTAGVHVAHKNIDLINGQALNFGSGAAGAGTVRVILASDSPGIGGGGGDATAANQATMIASLGVMDDWDESDRAKVNLVVGQAGITAGAGAVAANTPRLTLAGDDPAVASLALIAASASVMDDWDESDRAKVNIIAGQAGVAAGAGAAGATVVRTVTASDSPEIALLGGVTETAPASDTASSGLNGRLQRLAQRITSLIALLPAALGSQTNAGSLSVAPSTDQDPIFDHANGTKTSVTSSATIITTSAGHKYLRVVSDVDIFVNTAGATAVDDGTSTLIKANLPEVIPVPPSTAIKALSSSGTAVVRCTPLKVR